jgi:hypothetical protein
MVTVFDNFTISKTGFPESVGNNVVTDNPQAILLITPNTGYSVLAENFNITLPLPSNVTSVSFIQAGNLVECIVTFNNPFIMPASDVEIGLCLTGLARAVEYSVAGLINVTKTNATSSPANLSFNISENFNHVSVAKTVTLTATSGFYFPVEPTLIQTTGDTSIFSIADSKVFDIAGRLLSKTFTISCTMPNYNSLNNIFQAVAEGIQIFTPVPSITAYSIRSTVFPLNGETRDLLIYGGYSGNWTLTTTLPILQTGPPDPITGIIPYGTSASGQVGPTGFSTISIQVPSVTASASYSIALSGDLINPFPQSNPIILNQYGNVTITYIINNSAFFTNNGNKTNSGPSFTVPINGADGELNNFNWDITPSNGYGLMLINQPSVPGFDPIGGTPSSANNIINISNIVAAQVSSSLITVNVTGSVGIYGTASIDTTLDLGGIIAYIDTNGASNVAATTATSGGSVLLPGGSGIIGIKGLCYSTSPLPTIADSIMPAGTGFGTFTSNLTGLDGSTLYYTRAYAYDSTGTNVFYGPEKTFTTLPELEALPTTFVTNEDTNFTIQLLSMSVGPPPDFVITSLPDPLQGDIYDPGTGLKIATVPYTLVNSGSTVLFDPALDYFGNVDPFNFKLYQNPDDSNIAAVTGIVLAVNDSPIFMQSAPLYDGIPGGTYTYVGYVTDPDTPDAQLVVTFVPTILTPSLPSGWTFAQTPGTNQFTLTGPVPSGATYSITLQVSDGTLVTQQQVEVNAVFATLSSMEFKLEFIKAQIPAGGFGQSPKTTSPIVLSSQPNYGVSGGFNNNHTCNRAQFNLVAGVYANVSGGQWQWTDLGKGSLNNVVPGSSDTYNVYDFVIPILASNPYIQTGVTNILTPPYCPTSACNYINNSALQVDLGNLLSKDFVNGTPSTYYNSTTATIANGTDRGSYFDISTAEATALAIASNWGGSGNVNRGVVKFKLIPNSYSSITAGLANYHSDSSWLKVFKKNSAGTNQEEVLVGGKSFLLTASVVITVDILNNDVSVGTT